jgi:hypothetical protein
MWGGGGGRGEPSEYERNFNIRSAIQPIVNQSYRTPSLIEVICTNIPPLPQIYKPIYCTHSMYLLPYKLINYTKIDLTFQQLKFYMFCVKIFYKLI